MFLILLVSLAFGLGCLGLGLAGGGGLGGGGVFGGVWRVLRDAAPLMLAELVPSVASLVDMWFVRGFGDVAVGGVGVGGYLLWLVSVPLSAVYTGGLVVFSQAFGGYGLAGVGGLVGGVVSLSLILSLVLVAVGYVVAPLLSVFLSGGSPGVAGASAVYVFARLPGLPGFAVFLVFDALLRSVGRNRWILEGSVAASLANVLFDALLVPVYGVAGAGAATALGNYAGSLLLAFRVSSLGVSPLPRLPGGGAFRALRVGGPAAVERGLFAVGHGLYLASLGRCGVAQLTAHALGVRVESLAFLPAFALATYASSVVGNLVGAGRVGEAKAEGWVAARASAAFMAFAGLLLAVSAPLVSGLLSPDPHVGRLVVVYLLLAAATEPALGLVMSLAGALRGAGETRLPTVVNLSVLYLVRVAPSWLVPRLLGPGDCCALAAWLLMDLDVVVRAVVFAWIYRAWFERLARRVV